MGPRVLVIDNYDSFVFNLVQYLGELGAEPVVYRNDEITVAEIEKMPISGLVVSPGPGRPEDSGVSPEAIRSVGQRLPVLGVCLGHQCIGQIFGGRVVRAPEIMHGKTSPVYHREAGLMAGLESPFTATRYHSLVVEPESLPDCLEVTAWTREGVIMGLRHRSLPIEGVQFHPESILTDSGHQIVGSFIERMVTATKARPG
jgi:anthranilate synthase/aminodeoxychorismate synthase-like glutamine amidotransferase